jgi:hypothetical protein
MTTNRSKYVVHLESATRAPVVPQLATGESQDHGDEQVESNLSPGLDLTFRTGSVEPPESLTSHGFSFDGRDPMLIRERIQSQHHGSFRYFIYILIDRKRGGIEAVWGYCCSCPNGLRTVECCSHIATVLWFLGLGKYLPEILIPASFLDDCLESVG